MSEDSETPEPKEFFCPNCGAGLPQPETQTVTCGYCGTTVLVPDEYLPQEPQFAMDSFTTIVIQPGSAPAPQPTRPAPARLPKGALVVVLVALALVIIVPILLTIGFYKAMHPEVEQQVDLVATMQSSDFIAPTLEAIFIPTEPPTETPTPFANLVMQFGGEGTGPGLFQDPRQITVDPVGYIYVADYQTGRVQQFDGSGGFLRQVMVEPSENQIPYISDLTADYFGHFYVVRGGDILIYDAADGELHLSLLGEFPSVYFDAAAVDPSNNLYALASVPGSNALIKIGSDAETLWSAPEIISGEDPQEAVEDDIIAVDGLGNTYFLTVFVPQVYSYDADGKYRDRFGSQGDGLGQLSNPQALAVDGQGRIFVLDNGSIDIFDKNGAFLQAIAWDYSLGAPRDLALDLNGDLYVVTSAAQVLKYELAW